VRGDFRTEGRATSELCSTGVIRAIEVNLSEKGTFARRWVKKKTGQKGRSGRQPLKTVSVQTSLLGQGRTDRKHFGSPSKGGKGKGRFGVTKSVFLRVDFRAVLPDEPGTNEKI